MPSAGLHDLSSVTMRNTETSRPSSRDRWIAAVAAQVNSFRAAASNCQVLRSQGENTMTDPQPNNPLHGLTLERMLTELVDQLGWPTLGRRISIRCFNHEPSIASSLKFLRRTPWARAQVEALYLESLRTRDVAAGARRSGVGTPTPR